MAERQFDSVTFKSKGKEETIVLELSKFDGGKKTHTATATVSGRTLKVSATVDDKKYGLTIDDVDLETGTKVQRGNGQFKVLVTKTSDYNLEDKYKG